LSPFLMTAAAPRTSAWLPLAGAALVTALLAVRLLPVARRGRL
jgi:hypothetical protein